MRDKTYLGDGVYIQATETGEAILTTENGLRATNTVFVEGAVAVALVRWLVDAGIVRMPQEIPPKIEPSV